MLDLGGPEGQRVQCVCVCVCVCVRVCRGREISHLSFKVGQTLQRHLHF